MSRRRGQPNYYLRRTEKARREEAARRAARSPDAIAARLLEHIDVESIAENMTRALDGDDDRESGP